ncbi:MAG: type II toxin-antitoxin system RelE/ParE family toxin [Ignavibacteriota bacterium]|jgi:mRNA interferase RelE/StbE|uniref:type II toxin-antitoxin system RelE family toxin n=1 Tax=Ignavibacterium album TaxID=591197 RepID=UPI00142CE691|nr:MAG: type II toxin-antitoxin system RelE/ParE family toxin [Chlorobiota bacterium]MBE7477833.1 type II toxin-antitoxin system RelE/ParE family toxin [Ignavibacteriales bacterium]MBL1124545.1 type II toxin-antitoxin system RelE/ParE family toxin [Ignavibacteriota bacterium]MCE7858078.1 type II toxin-antitoxin system RelE/ParE family toxin [Ignavibacteria bacterium CHB3]MCZ7612739.1 type II toxin-antitoxin system RelE/ParE family toxin [Ignavibacteriaceae bacterium]
MKLLIDKSFVKDVEKVSEKKILNKLSSLIRQLENSKTLTELPNVKKIKGYNSFYRIRIGDYRLGLEEIKGNGICLTRFLHRKDIYKYFP